MDDFSITITVEREPAIVFAFIAEPANMTRWYEAVDDVALVPGAPVAAGTAFEITRSLPGGRATNVVEIAEYEPNRLLALESRQGPTPFRYSYTLEPTGAGTRVVLLGRISGEGLPGPAAHLGPLAAGVFKRGMKRNLNVLKDLIESDAMPGS